MGGSVPKGETNDELIDNLVEAKFIKSEQVEQAFRAVDRAYFHPGEYEDDAYKDLPMKCGNLHISAPCIYTNVMENFELGRGLSFLNIGSGTGYLSTMVGLIIGPYAMNHGIDIYPDLLEYSNKNVEYFIKYSPGFDHSKFCKPRFFLCDVAALETDLKYDRVYCGARIPNERFLDNVKKFVCASGILIYTFGESLVKMKRLEGDMWEVSHLSHVQFSDLQIASDEIAPVIIYNQPCSLKAICRTVLLTHISMKDYHLLDDLHIPNTLIRYLKYHRDGQPPSRMRKARRNSEDEEINFRIISLR